MFCYFYIFKYLCFRNKAKTICLYIFLYRGVIVLENDTFGLEPVPKSSTNEHVLYHFKDTQFKSATCGVVNEAGSSPSFEHFEPDQTLVSLLRVRCSFSSLNQHGIRLKDTANVTFQLLMSLSVCSTRGSVIYREQVMWSWRWLSIIPGWVNICFNSSLESNQQQFNCRFLLWKGHVVHSSVCSKVQSTFQAF